MGAMSWWHWLIVLVVVLLLFGSKKLPDAARGLGQSLRIFKSEVQEMQREGDSKAPASPSSPDEATPQRELPSSDSNATGETSTAAHTSPDQTKKSA
ncbi:Sec-independent protein translocase subunit TatA [Gordonia aichiensis]|uniref:Sec-independent protein translocase protein TatA n=1 Tax=Gordonia aichiensis NBRC 108223 TaxID=1220583 RepID=L7KKG0_9ACTN|nr:Sec-independent protein translocase subunit TatA [Gordonia aichiensis]GAC48447.1 Sec-independent protein translocase protein TatA/E homolog [Gordonia aichiensis NBRC 108223]